MKRKGERRKPERKEKKATGKFTRLDIIVKICDGDNVIGDYKIPIYST